MEYDYHIVLGVIATIVGLLGYVAYYRDIFSGAAKPHPFSWLGFGLLNAISFVAQVVKGGGPGTWVTGVSTIATLGIAFLALQRGEKRITKFDWTCFVGGILGIGLWIVTNDPLIAVIIVTITDFIVFAPTYRKAYLRPHEETITNYALSAVKYSIGMVALSAFNWTTALYPASLVISNVLFVAMIIIRRRQLRMS